MSLTQPNSGDIANEFNYVLPVYDKTENEIVQRLWFLDTGVADCLGIPGYGCIEPSQVSWFRDQNFGIPLSDPSKGKGFLFIHIPLVEYMALYNDYEFYGSRGELVSCPSANTGVFTALKEQPTVDWVTCGHEHANDYYGEYYGINLAYGRKTGYGCYGPTYPSKPGARVFEVTEEPYTIETWIREAGGLKITETTKKRRDATEPVQTECAGMQGIAGLPSEF